MQQLLTNINPKLRTLIIAGIGLLVVTFIVLWVRGHSFIEISATPADNNVYTYTFVNQDSDNTIVFESDKAKVKRLVPTGTYQISVQSNTASLITTSTTRGFLATSRVSGELQKESARQFVGYNPSPCSIYLGQVLYSYECGAEINSINRHVPATVNQPTYTENAGLKGSVEINGIVNTAFGVVMFTAPEYVTEEIYSADYRVSLLGDDMSVLSSIDLNYLALGQTYKFQAYRDGFIIYNEDLSEVYQYLSFESEPIKLDISTPSSAAQRAIGLSVSANSIVRYYSNNLGGEEDTEDAPEDEVLSEIHVSDGKTNVKYTTPEFLLGVSACAEIKLCILSGDSVLTIYKITNDELEKEYAYTNVKELHQLGATTYFVTDLGIVNLNALTGTGHYTYSFGDYTYCGLETSSTESIVCLIDNNQKKLALSLSASQPAVGNMDKQITKFTAQSGIENTSIYKDILFVTPIVAEPGEDITLSPKQVETGRKNLARAIKNSGLDASRLTIINTTDQF